MIFWFSSLKDYYERSTLLSAFFYVCSNKFFGNSVILCCLFNRLNASVALI